MVFSLEMVKTLFLLYFCLAETQKDTMEMCWHGRTGVETDQDRVSGEKQGSSCWQKQQECPASATWKVCHLSRSPTIFPQDPFELCQQPTSSCPHSSAPQMWNHVATNESLFLWSLIRSLVRHPVLWPRLCVMDTHTAAQGGTQQSLGIDELVLLWNIPHEIKQERT